MHTRNCSTEENESGGLTVGGQPGPHSGFPYQKKEREEERRKNKRRKEIYKKERKEGREGGRERVIHLEYAYYFISQTYADFKMM